MNNSKQIEYEPRSCDCCAGEDLEQIREFVKTARTANNLYSWQVRIVICRSCGFVFVSPVPRESSLEEYYTETIGDMEGQRLDYSIQKRIDLIEKCLKGKKNVSYIEVGGSTRNSTFTKALPANIENIKHIEIDAKSHRDGNRLDPRDKADIIVTYYALEHIPKPKSFLASCFGSLKDGGILIIEVPDLDIYPLDPSGLKLWEHTNHFSPRSLCRLASSQGFQLVEISHESCSRSYGFAAVFIKNSQVLPINPNYSDYLTAKASMLGGIEKLGEYTRKLQTVREKINMTAQQGSGVIVWAANAICTELLEGYDLPSKAIVVDSNPDKKGYLGHIDVQQPLSVINKIKEAGLLVINTRNNAEDIIKFISDKIGRDFKSNELIVVDNF